MIGHHLGRRLTRQRGFSIAETLTATAVIAVVTAIAVPNFVSLSANYQLTGTAQQLAFDISRARMKAIGENVYTRVRFATEGSAATYWFERSNDGTTYTADGVATRLPKAVSYSSLPETAPSFNRLGLATGTSTIRLANTKGRNKTITVTVLGKVTVQ